jgi:hypothetical protein
MGAASGAQQGCQCDEFDGAATDPPAGARRQCRCGPAESISPDTEMPRRSLCACQTTLTRAGFCSCYSDTAHETSPERTRDHPRGPNPRSTKPASRSTCFLTDPLPDIERMTDAQWHRRATLPVSQRQGRIARCSGEPERRRSSGALVHAARSAAWTITPAEEAVRPLIVRIRVRSLINAWSAGCLVLICRSMHRGHSGGCRLAR